MKLFKNVSLAHLIPGTYLFISTLVIVICVGLYYFIGYNTLSKQWTQTATRQMLRIQNQLEHTDFDNADSVLFSATLSPNVKVIGLMHAGETIISVKQGENTAYYENHFENYSILQSEFVADSKKPLVLVTGYFGRRMTYIPVTIENTPLDLLLVTEMDFITDYQQFTQGLLLLTFILLLGNLVANFVNYRILNSFIIKPLNIFTYSARMAQKRNYSEQIPKQNSKELSYLALSFNEIQQKVRHTINNLEHNQFLYKVFADALPQACAMVKMDGGIVTRFGPINTLFFSSKSSNRIMDFVPNNSDLLLISHIRDCHGLKKTLHAEINIGTDETPIHYDFSFTPVTQPVVGEPVTLVTAQNISERKKHEQTLSLLASVFESREAIAITDSSYRIIRVNQEFCRITGYQESQLILQTMDTCASEKHDATFWGLIWDKINDQGSWAGELTLQKSNGSDIPIRQTVSTVRDDHDNIQNYVIVFSDISEQKKAMALVRYHANFDTLTDLPNRRLFMNQLSRAMSQAARHKFFSALIFVDLDNFKQINDSYGHQVGDKVLIQIAKRIKHRIRNEDFLARLSGDEFVILLNQLGSNESTSGRKAQKIADTILQEIRLPIEVEQQNFLTSGSLGVTLFSDTEKSAFDIMRESDTAMYQAKNSGRNNISFFSVDMQATVQQALKLAHRISLAINEKEFRVFYQPQFNEMSQLIGMEALVRWNPDSEDSLAPSDFIPVAEESGKIVELGDFILFEALRHLQIMIERGLPDSFKRLAINISPRQFMEHNFEQRIIKAIEVTNVPPSKVELEITEGSLMDNNDHALQLLERLKVMGFSIAIDDFGTGYSSLAYLKSLPIDKLKIDQYFVRDIAHNQNDAQIVKTIISMAHAMGLRVIAEGVETREQLDFLRANDCLEYQGYYFSKPLSMDNILQRYFKKTD